ncbi:hypothetical protein IMSHALPRED_004450 [Imshaugia aleurites]|uniref:Uncharacterized protein n=1 Tax=Imshaugia aleurites TaxID=172621 RepID=A0A8H3IKJ8_9LECA|nr:hypothetical protein IMSHALPRED_004450 [Imshaugia aleurites]
MGSTLISPPNLTPYERFLERCSLPELNWYISSVSDHFAALLARSDPYRSVRLSTYLTQRFGHFPQHASDVWIPVLPLDEGRYSPKHVGVDLENRTLFFPELPSSKAAFDDGKQTSPLSALASFLASLLATTLWDKSVQNPKHSRVRFINNTFIVIDGIYKRLSERQSGGGEAARQRLYAVGVIQIVALEKLQKELQEVEGVIKVIPVPSDPKISDWPTSFLPIEAVGDVAAQPASEVTERPPLHYSNGVVKNGVHPNGVHTNGVELDGEAAAESEPVTLVVPSAGRSSRFPGVKPKWMLTQPSGCLMVVDALGALDLTHVNHVVIGLLKEHVDKYCGGDVDAILKIFEDGVPRLQEIKVSIVVIAEETVDQTQTIECILNAAKVTGPIFLKDCDNQFKCSVPAVDGVATLDITRETESGVSNVASKGYVAVNSQTGQLTSIVEKMMVSNTFCIGGYAWKSARDFLSRVAQARQYQIMASATTGVELAVSDVIWLKMATGAPFLSIPASGYEDWGTLPSWRAYCDSFKTLFVDIDGTLVKNSGQYFAPTWGTTAPLPQNVAHLNRLHATGRVRIILVTSRLEKFRDATVTQLQRFGVRYDQILFGMLHASRVVVNDYAPTNPYPSAECVNIPRNAEDLPHMLPL